LSSWKKQGRIIQASGNGNWYHSGFSGSQAILKDNNTIELFLTGRDEQNRSRAGNAVFDLNTRQLTVVAENPLLELGERGTFDFNGTGYPFVIQSGDTEYMFYTGWTKGVHVDFINDLGLATKDKNTAAFNRVSKAPIFCRTHNEPFGTGSVCVMKENEKWRIWYTCFDRWLGDENSLKHFYHIKYAEGTSATNWVRSDQVAIPYHIENGEYVTAKPFVIKYRHIYLMWFSYRGDAYKIGLAISKDGIHWQRHDHSSLCIQESDSGWDSEMVCYASVVIHNQTALMFYNGNGYGKSGLGWATTDVVNFDNELKNLGYLT